MKTQNLLRIGMLPLLALVIFACQKDLKAPSLTSDLKGGKPPVAKDYYDVPSVEASATQTTITLTVTAGESGAPAGFSVQWMEKSYYDQFGWNGDECKASFSGNANESPYNLADGESVDVVIGNLDLTQPGASVADGCGVALECGKTYVFRVFAHADAEMKRSAFSQDYEFSTLPCGECHVITVDEILKNSDAFLGSGMTIGGDFYSQEELEDILKTTGPDKNALIKLGVAIIVARVNGISTTEADELILNAEYNILETTLSGSQNSFGADEKGALQDAVENKCEG